jgi:hypothetical protein
LPPDSGPEVDAMRAHQWWIAGAVLLAGVASARPADPQWPLAETYLHAGELAKGEQALEAALAARPKDDQVRFGLGVIRFAQGVERLGQALHEYGVKSEHASAPFLRIPVPPNPDPAPIRYQAFRRVLDDFRRDLAAAEHTLAGVTDEAVRLPVRLAKVRLDLNGDGNGTDELASILKKLLRRDNPDFLKGNPDFLVGFDRGDVAWLRAYCHLLMGMLDFYLAFDTEPMFDAWARDVFARPRVRAAAKDARDPWRVVRVAEPARLGRFRRHLLRVCELNRETWSAVRAETDNDHEWLPNPKQTGVLGLPVRDEMIDAWLGMVGELEAVLQGKKLLPVNLLWQTGGKGLDVKALLDDPPARFDFDAITQRGPAAKYLANGPAADLNALFRVATVFDGPLSVAYAAWFN